MTEEMRKYIEKCASSEALRWWPLFITVGFVLGFGVRTLLR